MANRYWRPGGNGIWSSNTNWSTTDTGATGQAAPGTADIAFFTANSGTGTVTIDGNKTFQQLNCTGYAGTWQANGDITVQVTTHLKLSPNMSFGTQFFTLASGAGTANINFDEATFPYDYLWNGTGTKTLLADLRVLGQLRYAAAPTVNGAFEQSCYGLVENGAITTPRSAGGTAIRVKGGIIDRIRKSTGTLYLDGDISIPANSVNPAYSVWGGANANIEYVSGTITIDTMSIGEITGTSSLLNFGENVKFGRLDISGTITTNTDLYVQESIQCSGTVTATFLSDNPQKLYVATEGTGDVIMYNLGTFISSSVEMVYQGTGILFNNKSFNNMTFSALNAFAMDLTIDTDGVVTFFKVTDKNKFGGGRTLKYVKGNVSTTGINFALGGAFTFDLNSGFVLDNLYVDGYVANFISDATINNLYIYNAGVVQAPNDGTKLTINTSLDMKGAYGEYPAILASPITLKDFQGRDVEMQNTRTVTLQMLNRVYWEPTGFTDTWTVAFDFIKTIKSTGSTIIAATLFASPSHYIWRPVSLPNAMYYIITSTQYNYFSLNTIPYNQKARIVITKTYGSKMTAYINGANISVYEATTVPRTTSSNFGGVNREATGDVLFFNSVAKDADWVAADYAKFVANGGSSDGCYDETEPDLFVGAHIDQYTFDKTAMKIDFLGDINSASISGATFSHIDASGGKPLLNWLGKLAYGKNVINFDSEIVKATKASYA